MASKQCLVASTQSTWPSESLRVSRVNETCAGRRRAEGWTHRLRPVHDADEAAAADGVPIGGATANSLADSHRPSLARERLRF